MARVCKHSVMIVFTRPGGEHGRREVHSDEFSPTVEPIGVVRDYRQLTHRADHAVLVTPLDLGDAVGTRSRKAYRAPPIPPLKLLRAIPARCSRVDIQCVTPAIPNPGRNRTSARASGPAAISQLAHSSTGTGRTPPDCTDQQCGFSIFLSSQSLAGHRRTRSDCKVVGPSKTRTCNLRIMSPLL